MGVRDRIIHIEAMDHVHADDRGAEAVVMVAMDHVHAEDRDAEAVVMDHPRVEDRDVGVVDTGNLGSESEVFLYENKDSFRSHQAFTTISK